LLVDHSTLDKEGNEVEISKKFLFVLILIVHSIFLIPLLINLVFIENLLEHRLAFLLKLSNKFYLQVRKFTWRQMPIVLKLGVFCRNELDEVNVETCVLLFMTGFLEENFDKKLFIIFAHSFFKNAEKLTSNTLVVFRSNFVQA